MSTEGTPRRMKTSSTWRRTSRSFRQLIAGPILRYKNLAHQFRERTHTFEKFSAGSLRFMVGFCKKVLIADGVAGIADAAFAVSNPTAADAWLGALAYAVQLYFDFSGYSDMAIGLGLMMGFKICRELQLSVYFAQHH